MNEIIINFSLEVIKLSIVVSLAVLSLYICTLIIYETIRVIIIKIFNKEKLEIPIKDRFDEARKKDIEIMLKRQGIWHKLIGKTDEQKDKNER
jgi:hypothetical protein